jgi:hypothetical protein
MAGKKILAQKFGPQNKVHDQGEGEAHPHRRLHRQGQVLPRKGEVM